MSPPSSVVSQTDSGAEPDFPPLRVVAVDGADAMPFLQGQLTCDVAALEPGIWSWFGYCNPAGRLMVTGRLGLWANGFFLQVPEPFADELVQRLRRFVLRARVAIHPPQPLAGRAWSASDPMPGDETLPAPGRIHVSSAVLHFGVAPDLAIAHPLTEAARAPTGSTIAAAAVRMADVRAGAPWVLPATRETFIPQMLGLDAVGGVSFSKGCYPGQEIVARARYRGAIKRGPYLAIARRQLAPGVALCSARFGAQQAGTVVQAAPDGSAWLVHAVIEHSAAREALAVQATGEPLSDVRALHEPA